MPSHRLTVTRPRSTSEAMLVAVVAMFALLVAACGGDAITGSGTGGASEAAAAPASAPTAGGGQFDFGDLEGSPAMLWFWAPW